LEQRQQTPVGKGRIEKGVGSLDTRSSKSALIQAVRKDVHPTLTGRKLLQKILLVPFRQTEDAFEFGMKRHNPPCGAEIVKNKVHVLGVTLNGHG